MNALVEGFNTFVNKFVIFSNNLVAILNYTWSILKTLWFGLTSLLSGVWNLILQVFNGGVFSYVGQAFNFLSSYLGSGTVIFISTLLLIIIFRIGVAFVFKILRLNIDYHNTGVASRTLYQHSKLKK